MKPIREEEYKGCTIRLYLDGDPENPRKWDNLGTMVCFHRRYNLGDSAEKHGYCTDDYNSWDEVRDAILHNHRRAIMLPMYMYDHSGLTVNTTGFSCPWDSGQIGFIFVSREKARQELGVSCITPPRKAQITDILLGEVDTYRRYLMEDVYGYVTSTPSEEEEDCWGFFGEETALSAAKEEVDSLN